MQNLNRVKSLKNFWFFQSRTSIYKSIFFIKIYYEMILNILKNCHAQQNKISTIKMDNKK